MVNKLVIKAVNTEVLGAIKTGNSFERSLSSFICSPLKPVQQNNNGLFNFMDYPRIFEYLLELNIKKLF